MMDDEENYEEEILSDIEIKNALKGDSKLFYEHCFNRYIVEYTEASKKGAKKIHEFYYARGNKAHRKIRNKFVEIKPNVEDIKVKHIK